MIRLHTSNEKKVVAGVSISCLGEARAQHLKPKRFDCAQGHWDGVTGEE